MTVNNGGGFKSSFPLTTCKEYKYMCIYKHVFKYLKYYFTMMTSSTIPAVYGTATRYNNMYVVV